MSPTRGVFLRPGVVEEMLRLLPKVSPQGEGEGGGEGGLGFSEVYFLLI